MSNGVNILKDLVNHLPKSAGVYKMLGANNKILYIGKARNLQNRVKNYTQLDGLSNRIKRMVFQVESLEIIETSNESEALILESNLIKENQPPFNVKLKDDSSYPYLAIPVNDKQIPKVYRGKIISDDYKLFGPFPNAKAAQKTLELLIKVFKLRTCNNTDYKQRKTPCLRYDMKLCSAPCVRYITKNDYAQSCSQAIKFMQGKSVQLIKDLEDKMTKSSENMLYEQALIYRDRIKGLSNILQTNSSAVAHNIESADVFALHAEGGKACIQLFMYRNNLHMGNSKIFPKAIEDCSPEQILHYAILLHYNGQPSPKIVYSNIEPAEKEVLEQALNIKIIVPKRLDKLDIVNQAKLNAENELKRLANKNASIIKQLELLADMLNFDGKIESIEMFDVSNTQGTNPVASMVVATDKGMQPSKYRKFAIRVKDTPDDYAMMYETLYRRYNKIKTSDDLTMPSIVMVDGGKGHLTTLHKVFEDLDLLETKTKLCAIAKGEYRDKGLETIYCDEFDEPLPITFNSPLIFLLQNIRDESHRTAIGYHRKLRSKAMVKSVLDEIPGLGQVKKKSLLNRFGSLSNIKNSSIKDLQKVDGIGQALAKVVYDYLH